MLMQVYTAVMSVLTLGVLIFVHELGHFLVAKWCRVCVLDFSIGFGRAIWKKKYGETTYHLRIIPLGGYVKMLGDDPFEKFGEEQTSAVEDKTQQESEGGTAPSPGLGRGERALVGTEAVPAELLAKSEYHFLNQSLPEKAAVVLAGPLFNIIFAFFAAVAIAWCYGVPNPVSDPIIGRVTPNLPAAAAGIKEGDRVISVDGVSVSSWPQLAELVRSSGGKELRFVIERSEAAQAPAAQNRGPSTLEIRVTGSADNTELNVLDGTYDRDPTARPHRIGIAQASVPEFISFRESLSVGAYHVWAIIKLTGKMFSAMFSGAISPSQTIGGPVAVFAGAASSAAEGFESVLGFMVLLSVSLGIFNLLPIPILDGGHLLFFLIEALKGKPINVKWLAVANQVGLTLLLCLMLFAVSNDIMRLLS